MEGNVVWEVLRFEELSVNVLYEILHLRSKVFVVEQSDVYLDADNKDNDARHVIGWVDGRIAVYCRIFQSGSYFKDAGSIGRVLVTQEHRGSGLGKELIAKAIESLVGEKQIIISAQLYLHKFYENFDFVTNGDPYFDGSVEHIEMCRVN